MAEPLTKEEREGFLTVANQVGDKCVILTAEQLRRYEASIAALEAELAHLRLLAELGAAVEGISKGHSLDHTGLGDIRPDEEWLVWEWPDEYGEHTLVASGPTALDALRAAEEDADAH